MDVDLSGLSVDELSEQLHTWAGRVAAGEARLIELLGEFDARGAWVGDGVLSCAHWAAWRLGLSRGTAREKVRVARCLRSLPLTFSRFREGRLSYAQARAITRVASAGDEQVWLDLAEHATAEQLERAVRGVRRSQVLDERAADPTAAEKAARDEVSTRWDEDGSLVVTLRISPEHAVAVMARLDEETAAVQVDRDARLAALVQEQTAAAIAGVPAGTPGIGAQAEQVPTGQSAPARAGVPAGTPLTGGDAAGQAWKDLVAAFPEGVPSDYTFTEPPYPIDVDSGTRLSKDREAELVRAYWEVVHMRRSQREAGRAWTDHLEAEALKAHLPMGRATRADGFIRALTRHADGSSMVKVQLLIDPLSGWARATGEELLPPHTVQAIIEDSANRPALPRIRPITTEDLTRYDQGRRSRLVHPGQRRLLGQLDGERCRMPSCNRVAKLHAHHVRFWRDGGPTDLCDLILVCSRHHTLIHQLGLQLTLHEDRSLTVTTAEGKPLEHLPDLPVAPAADLDAEQTVTAQTLPTTWTGERMDLHHVVWVMRQHAA